MFNHILVVCTGNICRSPMGEIMLQNELTKRGSSAVVSSAGIGAVVNGEAHKYAQAVMLEHGVDLSAHRARQIIKPMLQQTDLLLAMDQTHLKWVHGKYPFMRGRSFLFGHWQNVAEVPDPVRMPKEAFETTYQQLEPMITDWADRIMV